MSSQSDLKEFFLNNDGNVLHKWHHYFEIYERHFKKYRDTECVILEVGVSMGGSLEMWKDYFGERAQIFAIDIEQECKRFEDQHVSIFIGSQSDRVFLKDLKKKIPKVDILIDDGGHTMNQQIVLFEEMFDHINNDGVYLCEDTHTSYWKEYGGGFRKRESYIEYTKGLIDHLNKWHFRKEINLPAPDISESADSIHFYDSIVVIERRKRRPPYDEMRGKGENAYQQFVSDEEVKDFLMKLKVMGLNLPDNSIPHYLCDNHQVLSRMFGEKYEGKIWPESGETMIGYKRLKNFELCIREVHENKIDGDIVETGVWRGGACIYAKYLLNQLGDEKRNIWLVDSFEGLSKPDTENFPEDKGLNLHQYEELSVSVEEVKRNFENYGVNDDRVKILPGLFKDTLPDSPINSISVLRLDGDLYESTIQSLFYLYPKLTKGGYCIIDDWGAIPACKKAVIDYRRVFKIRDKVKNIDWTGVYWKKRKKIKPMQWHDFLKKLNKIRSV